MEIPQRRAGFTNKPNVVQHYETHREPQRKRKRMFRTGTETEERDPCQGLTLKTHQATKQDQSDAWQNTAVESVKQQQLVSFRQPEIVNIL